MDPDLAAGEVDVPRNPGQRLAPNPAGDKPLEQLLIAPSGLYQLVGLLLRGDATGSVEPGAQSVLRSGGPAST